MPRKTKVLISAAAYYRMSSDQQGGSIEQQKQSVRAYAKKNGYRIVKEYVDSGKSGVRNQQNRAEFQQLIDDAEQDNFKVILCWDKSRFTREDLLSAAQVKDRLRRKGIVLDTVKDGKSDWTSFAGLIQDAVETMLNHEYVRKLSDAVSRGRIAAIERGEWPHGAVPYGFDKLFVESNGTEHRKHRREKFAKPRQWKRFPVVNEDEAEVLKRMFRDYLRKDASYRSIAESLNRDGILRPDGNATKGWRDTDIPKYLSNKAYIGIAETGHRHVPPSKRPKFNSLGKHETEGVFPPIIDQRTFDAVQKKMEGRRIAGRKVNSSHAGLFSSIILCGHCGYPMIKHKYEQKNGTTRIYYRCKTGSQMPGMECRQWRVYEDDLLPVVIEKLVSAVDREILECLKASPNKKQPATQLKRLKKRLRELKRDIDKGTENVLRADDSIRAKLEERLRGWIAAAKKTEREIRRLEVEDDGSDVQFAKWWESMRPQLVSICPAVWSEADLRGTSFMPSTHHGRKQNGDTNQNDSLSEDELTHYLSQNCNGELLRLRQNGKKMVVEQLAKPPVLGDRDEVRGFLKEIGLTIVCYWKPKECKTKKGRNRGNKGIAPRWEVDRGRIEAIIDPERMDFITQEIRTLRSPCGRSVLP